MACNRAVLAVSLGRCAVHPPHYPCRFSGWIQHPDGCPDPVWCVEPAAHVLDSPHQRPASPPTHRVGPDPWSLPDDMTLQALQANFSMPSKSARTPARGKRGTNTAGGSKRARSQDEVQQSLAAATFTGLRFDSVRRVHLCSVEVGGETEHLSALTPFLACLKREQHLVEVARKTPTSHPDEPWCLACQPGLRHWVRLDGAGTPVWSGPRWVDLPEDTTEETLLAVWRGGPRQSKATRRRSSTTTQKRAEARARPTAGRQLAQPGRHSTAEELATLMAKQSLAEEEEAAGDPEPEAPAASLAAMQGAPPIDVTEAHKEDDCDWVRGVFPGITWDKKKWQWTTSLRRPGRKALRIQSSSAAMVALLCDHHVACLEKAPPGTPSGDKVKRWFLLQRPEFQHWIQRVPGCAPKWVGPDPYDLDRHCTLHWLQTVYGADGVRGRQQVALNEELVREALRSQEHEHTSPSNADAAAASSGDEDAVAELAGDDAAAHTAPAESDAGARTTPAVEDAGAGETQGGDD